MGKITIIVPVYNAEKYIRTMLDSVLCQTYQDFEIICIDDGSTDSSLSILKEYASKDHRFEIISQENKGSASARNRGLDRVKTTYVTFIDADDIVHPSFLSIMMEAIQKNNADFVWCKDQKFYEDKTIEEAYHSSYPTYKEVVFSDIFKHFTLRLDPHPSVMMNKVYRASLLKDIRFNENLRHVEDILFSHYMFHKADKAVYVELVLYYYRQHGQSVSNVNFSPKYIEDHISVGEEIANYFRAVAMDNETKEHFWFRTSKMMLKNPLAQPWRKNRKEAQYYWSQYRERLQNLYEQGLFRIEYLDLRNRILARALLSGRYWLLRIILKLSYW